MRALRTPWSVVVVPVMLLAACKGSSESKDEKTSAAQAAAKATVAAVTETAKPAPTATEAPEPEPTPTPAPTAQPTAAAEETQADASGLKLIGIVRAGAPSAIIGYEGRQEIFRRGDSVFDHGTVKEVREDSVVLHAGTKDVTLTLPAEEAPPAQPTAAEDVVEAKPPVAAEAPAPLTQPLSRAEARSGLKDLKGVLEKADAARVAVGGGHGLQLKNVEPGSFLGKLGLRSGDVLQKLNDAPIDDLGHLPDLGAAAEGRELTVGYTRDDIGLTITRAIQ